MKFFAIAAAVSAVFSGVQSAMTTSDVDLAFENFKVSYNKAYLNADEEAQRKSIFTENIRFIEAHNMKHAAGLKNYRVDVNNFADMTNEEFRVRNGFKRSFKVRAPAVHESSNVEDLPATVDWTTKGLVAPIKDQGQCGSCWAFSAVASMEGQHAKATGKMVSLSEQNLVDCSGPEGDMGCGGGLMDNAFNYVISNKGIDTEKSYPYKATDGSCSFKKQSVGATIKSFVDIPSGDENALQNAVATVGPISVAIDASQMSFQFYKDGVYDEPNCSPVFLDHGVTAVGYGTLNNTPYWKVKNSWGTVWGEKGYILMSRNKSNQCGIATKASYPVV